ncbi:hypothetical protein QG516_02700 [Pedobacter gandavensis]|uniref:hypothetical protein n=1 Tax=Pedobacter TaxID=84567 RepID=UPI001C998D10|nr:MULTISPECIES: hypothetical protein [Pedobacter]WGQ10563.1 hypothetical protein QG516_02700 [Pedobacter gandavensis]
MDPFNIMITIGNEKLDLNIHPEEAGSYKIIYHGALVGEIFMGQGESWEAISADDLDPFPHPIYKYDETSGHAGILLEQDVVQQIGEQIKIATNRI